MTLIEQASEKVARGWVQSKDTIEQAIYVQAQAILAVGQAILTELDCLNDSASRLADAVEELKK